MLSRTSNSVRCYIPDEERQIMSSSLDGLWKGIHVSPIDILGDEGEQCCRVLNMLIETKSMVMLWLTSETVEFKWEMFRLSITSKKQIVEWGMYDGNLPWESPVVGLENLSGFLDIDLFLKGNNDVSLLKFAQSYSIEGKEINETTESGLLIANHQGRMLVFDPEDIPLTFCITTNHRLIESKLKDAEIIPLLSA